MRLRHREERFYRVAHTSWEDGTRVSTVLLSVDHWFVPHRDDPTFETMIFPVDVWDDFQRRYRTIPQALEGHDKAVRLVIRHKGQHPNQDDRIVHEHPPSSSAASPPPPGRSRSPRQTPGDDTHHP